MSKHQQSKQQQSNQATEAVVVEQTLANMPADQYATLRSRRLALVQAGRAAQYRARKHAAHEQAQAAWQQAQEQLARLQAYHTAVAQLQAEYGVVPEATVAPRANSATTQPSATVVTINGVQYIPTKAVHKLCELYNGVRKDVLAACKSYGINPSTAATQYGVWKKQNPTQ
jgi:hypothetical protein